MTNQSFSQLYCYNCRHNITSHFYGKVTKAHRQNRIMPWHCEECDCENFVGYKE